MDCIDGVTKRQCAIVNAESRHFPGQAAKVALGIEPNP
jgi:hypothetical protein